MPATPSSPTTASWERTSSAGARRRYSGATGSKHIDQSRREKLLLSAAESCEVDPSRRVVHACVAELEVVSLIGVCFGERSLEHKNDFMTLRLMMREETFQHADELRRRDRLGQLFHELALQGFCRAFAELDRAAERPPARDGAGIVGDGYHQQLGATADDADGNRAYERLRPPYRGHSRLPLMMLEARRLQHLALAQSAMLGLERLGARGPQCPFAS